MLILRPLVTDGEHQGIHEKVFGHICRMGQDSVSKMHQQSAGTTL